MKFEKARYVIVFIAVGFFLFLDRYLKWQATHGWMQEHLVGRYFGWMPFLNPGVAFGIPLPRIATVVITVPILLVILYLLDKQLFNSTETSKARFLSVAGLASILFGSISNLIDRLWFGHTIDYVLVGTAVINLADVMIVVGFVLYFFSLHSKDTGHSLES